MTQLVHTLTAVAILVHTTVGCCAHEPHGSRDESRELIGLCGLGQNDHGQGDHGQGDHGHHDHSNAAILSAACPMDLESSSTCDHKSPQPAPHECRHADCNWPTTETRVGIDLMLTDFMGSVPWFLGAAFVSLLFVSLLFISLLGERSDAPGLLPYSSPSTVAVRTHLAKCVLLI